MLYQSVVPVVTCNLDKQLFVRFRFRFRFCFCFVYTAYGTKV